MLEVTVTDLNFSRMRDDACEGGAVPLWKDAGRPQSRSVGVMRALFGSRVGESSSRTLAIMVTVGLLDYRRVRGLGVFLRGDDAIRGGRKLHP